jgi:hypothetical protein
MPEDIVVFVFEDIQEQQALLRVRMALVAIQARGYRKP